MIAQPLKKIIHENLDPKGEATLRQREAANPAYPVWVEASAGSGKTKVLVDRMLHLMLPAGDRPACSPGAILCITFTKAAAAEVMERVTSALRRWTVSDDATLQQSLSDLLGETPSNEQLEKARALFAQVLDAPGGMKIMTIHAFCQSVLARFPLEAGLPAGFEMMDDVQARALMRDVRRNLIVHLINEEGDTPLQEAFGLLSSLQTIDDIERRMEQLSGERSRLRGLVDAWGGIDGLCNAVDDYLDIVPGMTDETLSQAFFEDLPRDDLQILCPALQADNKTNQKFAAVLQAALGGPIPVEQYCEAYLKKTDGNPYQPTGILKNDPSLLALWEREGARLQALMQLRKSLYTASCTRALLRFGITALNAYETEKRRRNLSDFEDLIALTKKLLSGDGVHWVQYKLDNGIDHILVDEAQDTNPDQWDIITSLYDEFYSGLSTRGDMTRTTFVVGDEKQSIYSFQRADPRIFAHQHDRLDDRTTLAQNAQQTIYLNASFRSGTSILSFVDTVFAPDTMMNGVVRPGTGPIKHAAADTGKAAHVELWPLYKSEAKRTDKSDPAAWDRARVIQGNPVQALADRIAATIRDWLDRSEILESQGRAIEPGDILILLAKRTPMAEPILRALRQYRIPVTGIDRMVLSQQIAVQDTLAALSFALAPDDDLTLAALLKSPFIGITEDALLQIAHGRETSLWDALRNNAAHSNIAAWLSALLENAGSNTASGFLHHVFYTSCPANALSGMRALLTALGSDAIDPLQELLARADRHALSGTGGLQGFLNEALADTSEIKRQMDASGNRVRLMTVHGAKGLEAPIVFLPDTIRTNAQRKKVDALQWPPRKPEDSYVRKPGDVPLWSADSKQQAPQLAARRQTAIDRSDEEYRRLLYVALTRPAERLYIAGAQTGTDGSVDGQSWYHACDQAFDHLELAQRDQSDPQVRFLHNAQTGTVKNKSRTTTRGDTDVALPGWALQVAPTPEFPPRPLMPSRPEGIEPATLSPLAGQTDARFRRGRLIHTLFQFLPELPADARRARATEWLTRPAHQLSPGQQTEIMDAVFGVLDHPDFAPLFGPQARVEVPITGMLGMAIVSGQIDRLLVTGDSVTILDYKTNRPAPKAQKDVSTTYKTQLRLYRDLLKKIYPDKDIRTALLWTDGPALMDMTLDL